MDIDIIELFSQSFPPFSGRVTEGIRRFSLYCWFLDWKLKLSVSYYGDSGGEWRPPFNGEKEEERIEKIGEAF